MSPSHNRHRAIAIAIAIAIATSWLVAPLAARAEAPTLRVKDDDASCPRAAELRTAIAEHLGRDPFGDASAPSVDVAVRRDGGLRAEITVVVSGAPPRTRTIDGDSCADLVRAAALVAALAIEEDEKPRPPSPPPPPPPSPSPVAPEPPNAAPSAEAPTVVPADSLRKASGLVLASVMTSVGLLPSSGAGIAGALRVRVAPELWLSARGLYLPPARMPDDTFAMSLAAGGVGACYEPFGSDRIAAVGCAHVVGGGLRVVDASVAMRDGTKGFAAASFSAGARARVAGPLVIEGGLETFVPFARPTFLNALCPPTGFQQPFATVAFMFGAGVSIP